MAHGLFYTPVARQRHLSCLMCDWQRHVSNSSAMEEAIKRYIPVDLSVLRIDTLKPFDIYITTGRPYRPYVLYSRRGQYFTNRIKDQLLQNNVKTIYIDTEDHDLYQEYVEDNLQYIIKDTTVPPEQKSKLVYDSSRYLMQKLFDNPRADMITRTRKTVNNIVSLILSDRRATSQLIRITEYDYYTYTHSVNVGVFSIAFARDLLQGMSDQKFYELGLGFFLHDIGKSRIPIEILNKRGALSEEEWKIMKTHPEHGYNILQETGFVSRDTAIIVLQHHERVDGTGYPRGLRGERLNVFGRICCLADVFDAMTTRRCYQEPFKPFDALTIIRDTLLRKEFDKDFFAKFVHLFGPEAARVL